MVIVRAKFNDIDKVNNHDRLMYAHSIEGRFKFINGNFSIYFNTWEEYFNAIRIIPTLKDLFLSEPQRFVVEKSTS